MQHPQGESMLRGQMQDCINDCLNCHNVCYDMAMSVLQQGKQAEYVRILLDCSELCLTAAHFMLRDSPLYGHVCRACVEVCNHCAGLCDQMGQADCANACRACANSCDQMVKMVAF